MLRLITLLVLLQQIRIIKHNVHGAKTTESATFSTEKRVPPRHYNPNYGYEPYWPGGDWVQALNTDPDAPTTTPPPMVCGRECHYMYRPIKHVCGRNIENEYLTGCRSWWVTCTGNPPDYMERGYETFDTYCKFLDKQCRSIKKGRLKINKYIFVHIGECEKQQDLTFKPMRDGDTASRMKFYLTSQEGTFQQLGRKPC